MNCVGKVIRTTLFDNKLGHVLSNNGLCIHAAAQYMLLFSTCGNFRLVSNFTKLHALTLPTRSYALLVQG